MNIDEIIDYRAEYTSALDPNKLRINGDNLLGLCPFHHDENPSFSANLKTGQWICFTEGTSGNFLSFYAKLHNVDTKTAYREILAKYHIQANQQPKQAQPKQVPVKRVQKKSGEMKSYGLDAYSREKKIPAEYLQKVFHLSTRTDKNGTTYLAMPYLNSEQTEVICRKRYGNKAFRWQNNAAEGIGLYGEWRLPEFIEKTGWVVLVEGESDTQALWYMGLPALGVPGANMFKPAHVKQLQGLATVYIHQEPDQGGETFVKKIRETLRNEKFDGLAFVWSCKELGYKDPSDVYIALGKGEAEERICAAMTNMKPLDFNVEEIPVQIPDEPIHLRQPEMWHYSEDGIFAIDPKTQAPICICRTPILLTRRLKNIETHEERIEIAFRRDEQWTTVIYSRDELFSSRGILDAARFGCTVTSENAKQVVKYLGALEAQNIDLIPLVSATSTFGWQPGRQFLPGCSKDIALDIDPSQRALAAAYCQNGSLDAWIAAMKPHRDRSRFRFILAASFAAPLLKIVNQRIFFVYNWGDSKSGKTAALKAALSVWGDANRLMFNFNATQVGLERTASFYCDLPLGIDERQLANKDQSTLEDIVYMIASGTGRIRGSKTGGLQTTYQWRTIALATGEEPISIDTTKTGVSTRALEIYGGPFNNETEAGQMHQQVTQDYGWAGPAFINRLVQEDESQIIKTYKDVFDLVKAFRGDTNNAHTAGISVVTLADILISRWLFGETEEQAWEHATHMASDILYNQAENNTTDVNENAVQFIADWVLSNRSSFGACATGPSFGIFEDNSDTVYIFSSLLTQTLTKAGYSPKKTLKYMAEQGLIAVEVDKSGKKVYSVRKWFGNKTSRFTAFYLGRFTKRQENTISPLQN